MLNGTVKTTVKLMASQQVNHGTFTLIFTGTLGSVTHSTSVSLTVK
jgi:microcompartment protein CcmL/EutN